MKRHNGSGRDLLDMRQAQEMVRAFSSACSVPCRLLDPEGNAAFPAEQASEQELFCTMCGKWLCSGRSCGALHADGGRQAERFGGRYIYSCPMGMGWIAAPILLGGQIRASLSCGPVMMLPLDDYIAGTPSLQERMTLERLEQISGVLRQFPRRSPADMRHISLQLLAAAVYIGDSSLALIERREEESQYQSIGEYLQQYKLSGAAQEYPFEKEQLLVCAIADGDESGARGLLNDLLGYLFFSSGSDRRTLQARSLELMAVLSRAAVAGGADPAQILSLNQRFSEEVTRSGSPDGSVYWLTRAVTRYTNMVFERSDAGRQGAISRAAHYTKRHLAEKVTLEAAAAEAGFSPSHFSRIFKEEMGCTFSEYVSRLRVEQSKILLLAGKLSVQEVGDAVGYGEQSYFIKVFRKYTGVSPGKFRRRQGYLKTEKERDSSEQ